jgi:hypothetical protein
MNMTTPSNMTLTIMLNTLYRTQINVIARRSNNINLEYRNQTITPELVRIAVVRRRPDTRQNGFNVESDIPADYTKELEVFDCTLGLTAHNFTAISVGGDSIAYIRFNKPLQPGFLQSPRSSGSRIIFSQNGLPTFQVGDADLQAISDFFESSRFTGTMTSGQYASEPPSGVVMALLKSSFADIFGNVAASMTEQLRATDDTVAKGVTWDKEVFVSIEWMWLILPVGVTIAAAVFPVITWISTRAQGCVPWKASAVALLYRNLLYHEDSYTIIRSDMGSLDEMAEAVENTKALLV